MCAGSQVVSLLILWASLVTPSPCLFLNFFGHTWCRILVLRPEIKLPPPALEVWSFNHWATREVPLPLILPQVISWLLFSWFATVQIYPLELVEGHNGWSLAYKKWETERPGRKPYRVPLSFSNFRYCEDVSWRQVQLSHVHYLKTGTHNFGINSIYCNIQSNMLKNTNEHI